MADSLVQTVEYRVTARALELRKQIAALAEKIEVRDFRLVDGHVTWSVHVPSTLLTLVHQLPDVLLPNGS